MQLGLVATACARLDLKATPLLGLDVRPITRSSSTISAVYARRRAGYHERIDHERRDSMAPRQKKSLYSSTAPISTPPPRSLGFDIDYKRLLREFQSRGYLLRAFYYTAVIEDQEYSSIRPLIDWLDYNGYTVVTKATKEFVDQTGRRKVKGNMDIELAVDAMELAGTSIRWCCFPATAISVRWSRPCSAAACA